MKAMIFAYSLILLTSLASCGGEAQDINQWNRFGSVAVFQDLIPSQNYQAASDPHVFFDGNDLKMIYTGDHEGVISIKLANGTAWESWSSNKTLLGDTGPSGLDENKETAFYRKTASGKHQIYYIGYDNEDTYQAQIFLAEADELEGPYSQMDHPIVARGEIAGEEVYCMTSPSIIEHDGLLYIAFIGWDNAPNAVTEVWIMGATSEDDGKTWSDFQKVDTPIGMEGQVTKRGENDFVAVSTTEFKNTEGIYYATASHPFGPWEGVENPIIVKSGEGLEKDETIAPQITINPVDNSELLYYTGVDYEIGWWIMLATEN